MKINTNKRLQEIYGFGASGAWWAQDVGGWSENKRKKVIDLLFDKEKGIGLTIYRYNVGAGTGHNIFDPWRKTESFELDKGKYDWNRDNNAVKIMKEVKEKGVDKFIFFANSPTARMTVSGRVTGGKNGDSNLSEHMYEDFSQYLIDITRYFIENEKIPVKWISPINEPEWDWQEVKGQEGCHYTPEECYDFLKVFIKKVKHSKIPVKVSAVEVGEWSHMKLYMNSILKDDLLRKELTPFAIHSYWSDKPSKILATNFLKENYEGTELWMSEWTEMQSGRDSGIKSALTMANVIHEDLTIASVTSWQYWIAVSKYDYRDGLIYTDEGKENIIQTKRLWGLGNYSKFIKPGYRRIEVECEEKKLKASAYIDKSNEEVVIVLINDNSEAVLSNIKIDKKYKNMDIYETSENNDLKKILSGKVTKSFEFSPMSITTIVFN